MTAFHGRGFCQTTFQVGDPQGAVAAVEALLGLLIEIPFIATFTQRFFARSGSHIPLQAPAIATRLACVLYTAVRQPDAPGAE
jgi:hypothetical protein